MPSKNTEINFPRSRVIFMSTPSVDKLNLLCKAYETNAYVIIEALLTKASEKDQVLGKKIRAVKKRTQSSLQKHRELQKKLAKVNPMTVEKIGGNN